MSHIKHWIVLLLLALGIQVASAPNEIQVGRYSTMTTSPTDAQKDIFSTVVNIEFDTTITTVGEAMRHLLQDQGVRLAVPKSDDAPVRTLIALPLPQVHRQLGPVSLRDALETLAGPVWRLVQDPINRLLSFELCSGQGDEEEIVE